MPADAALDLSPIGPALSDINEAELAPGEHPSLSAFRYGSYRELPATYTLYNDFVTHEIEPFMEMARVEEDFYPELWADWQESKFTIDELPRGHGKTEFGIWYTLWTVMRQPINPWWDKGGVKRMIQQLVVSSGKTEVNELGDRLEEYAFASPILKQLLPWGVKKGRTSTSWNKDKKKFANGSIIHFRQVKCRRNLHVDRIWLDDLITESSTLTDKDTKKFVTGTILPMGTAKRAPVNLTGTPLRYTDIIHAMDKTGLFTHTKRPAIIDWDNKIILSKRLSWEALMEAKQLIGAIKFEAEYQLNALDNKAGIIKREWVEACYDDTVAYPNYAKIKAREASMYAQEIDFDPWRDNYYAIYGGIDFAFSDLETSDWSVYVTIGDRGPGHLGQRYDLLELRRFQGKSLGEQKKEMREWYELWNHDLIGVEVNSIRSIVKDLGQLDMPFKLFWTGSVDERDKKKASGNSAFRGRIYSVSKRNFALRHGMIYENKKIRIPYKGDIAQGMAHQIMRESISWALEDNKLIEVGIHPDIPIAIGYALEIAEGHNFSVG